MFCCIVERGLIVFLGQEILHLIEFSGVNKDKISSLSLSVAPQFKKFFAQLSTPIVLQIGLLIRQPEETFSPD